MERGRWNKFIAGIRIGERFRRIGKVCLGRRLHTDRRNSFGIARPLRIASDGSLRCYHTLTIQRVNEIQRTELF